MQGTVLLVTTVLMLGILGLFGFVALGASKAGSDSDGAQAKSLSARAWLFWVAVVAGVIISVVTTLDLPYAATRGDTADATRIVDVEGRQWFWQLSDTQATVGDTVVFRVTSPDVNHGLGVYDESLVLLGQTQVMPGYTNSLKMRFEKPGTYKLLCMEYCGLAHHAMISDFHVVAEGPGGAR